MELGTHNGKPFDQGDVNLLVLGRKETGKTELAAKLALEAIHGNESVVVLDATGALIDDILDHMPKHRQKDVVLCDPSRAPFPLNIFADATPDRYTAIASALRDAVKAVWGFKISTANIDQYLKAGILTVLPHKGESLLSLKYVITDKDFRAKLLKDTTDRLLLDFWKDHEALRDSDQQNRTASTLSKIWAFALEPKVRRCIDHKDNRLDFKDKVVLVSLKEADLGADNTGLLGAIVLTDFYVKAKDGLCAKLILDPGLPFLPLVPRILTCPYVTTVLTLQSLTDTDVHGQVARTLAFRTGLKDAKAVKDDFPVGESATQLFELPPFVALLSGMNVVSLDTKPHTYPKTKERKKIEARSRSQFELPLEAIDKRLERFAYAPKTDRPRRGRRRTTP